MRDGEKKKMRNFSDNVRCFVSVWPSTFGLTYTNDTIGYKYICFRAIRILKSSFTRATTVPVSSLEKFP